MKTFVFVIFILFSCYITAQNEKYSRVQFLLAQVTIDKLANMGLPVEDGIIDKKNKTFTLEINETDTKQLLSEKIPFKIIFDNVSEFYINRNSKMPDNPPFLNNTKSIPIPTRFSFGSMGGFYTYSEMMNCLDSLAVVFPNLITAKQPIDSFVTVENRPIYVVKISDNPYINENEPKILFTALTHAREAAGMQQIMFFMMYLLENYTTNSFLKGIIDNHQLYFVPCVNPDGYVYNESTNPNGGGMWRKNRRNNGTSYGVDINRNMGYAWGYNNGGSSPDPNSDTYRGPAAFSEPETKAIKKLCEIHQFKVALNYHTFSNLLVYPWGFKPDFLTNDSVSYLKFAELLTKKNHYLYGTANQTVNYSVNGCFDDWMYGDITEKPKIFAFTPEAGSEASGFWPDTTEILNVCYENIHQNLAAIMISDKFLHCYDLTEPVISKVNGYLKFATENLGLSDTGTFHISIIPVSTNFLSVGAAKTYANLQLNEKFIDSIYFKLNTNIKLGDSIIYLLNTYNGNYNISDTIIKVYGIETVYFFDNSNNTDNWLSNEWGLSNIQFYSPGKSITDSPFGNYGPNENSTITLNNSITLPDVSNISLTYCTKWSTETDWDYVQIKISTNNGSSWTPLEGQYTRIGDISEPVYDGNHAWWVHEKIDLSSFVNQAVLFQFSFISDNMIFKDGFYFDDLAITSIDYNSNFPVVVANPIANDSLTINHATVTRNISNVFHDPNGDTMSLSIVSNSNPNLINIQLNNNILSYTPATDSAGKAYISIKATSDLSEVTNTFLIYVGNDINVDEIKTKNKIAIFPNPTDNFVVLQNLSDENNLKFQLFDVMGKLIIQEKIFNKNKTISLKELPNGLFYLKIINRNGETITIEKILKR